MSNILLPLVGEMCMALHGIKVKVMVEWSFSKQHSLITDLEAPVPHKVDIFCL